MTHKQKIRIIFIVFFRFVCQSLFLIVFSWGLFCVLRLSLDNKSAGRQSIASNLMKNDDEVDDGDSMAAYGEGDTGMLVQANCKLGVLNVQNESNAITIIETANLIMLLQPAYFMFLISMFYV